LHCASCNHEVCEDCKEWNEETVAELLAANKDNEEDVRDEESERSETSNGVTDESDDVCLCIVVLTLATVYRKDHVIVVRELGQGDGDAVSC